VGSREVAEVSPKLDDKQSAVWEAVKRGRERGQRLSSGCCREAGRGRKDPHRLERRPKATTAKSRERRGQKRAENKRKMFKVGNRLLLSSGMQKNGGIVTDDVFPPRDQLFTHSLPVLFALA